MRVDQIFAEARANGTQPVSFEMFPPKGELTLERAREVASGFASLAPDFISVTYSAGGSGNSAATAQIASMISSEFNISTVAHLTCISLTRETLAEKILEFMDAGIENVLALRGDLPAGMSEAEAGDIAFPYAKDLVPALVDAGFCVGGAAYPEGHLTCDDLPTSVKHLRQKQDAGASFLVTQLFFDNEYFYRFRELADAAGITIPITVGIMPFTSKQQVTRMVFTCAASLPAPVIKILARFEDDPESLRAAGIEYACRQLEDLAAHGVDGLHVYTMNRADVAAAAMSALRG
ncbi:methylenetetrahydrofolate reductase [Collinsella tanakaei]|uniref:methylenetetrahydrofolate reductase n=1 Tax=Collinsella tanakaei TaxID=626935 RepID=UPI0025A48ACA|nr:methylenetetrahydrofolate reductase [Collinsella tanakaei]MDM8246704.1 methylenetetrahydrofolate reductase [Collinsella tanakaei]